MKLKDSVYGKFDIDEEVLVELINSKAVQRLKNISQGGLPKEFRKNIDFSRYDHSIGVLLLLRILGAEIEEQIAGLLHDVSHTAFSHIADYVLGDKTKEDYQDKNHERIILNSDIPLILKKYGYDANTIIELEKYTLLESEAPSLCADRIDYTLRVLETFMNPTIVKPCVENLINYNGRIIFKTRETAELFAVNYLKCQIELWDSPKELVNYYLFSKLLKLALGKNIIHVKDFDKDDDYLLNKVKNSNDPEIKKLFAILSKENNFKVSENSELNLRHKFRYVDPNFLENDKMLKLTEVNKEYSALIQKEMKKNKDGLKVNIFYD